MSEKLNKLQDILDDNCRSLKISRVPLATKRRFIQIANDEFAEDYGLLLKDMFDSYIEYRKIKKYMIELIESLEAKNERTA